MYVRVCELCVCVCMCMYMGVCVSGDGIPVCWLFILVLSNYMHNHSTRTNHLWMEKLGVMGVMVVGCYPSQNLYCWDLRLDQGQGYQREG